MTFRTTSCRQLVEQCLRLLQIARVKSFGEPAVDRSEKFASLLPLALIAPEPREAHGGTSILGGRGNYLGTVAGVILITLLESILSVMQISDSARQIIYGAMIIVMMLVYGRDRRVEG